MSCAARSLSAFDFFGYRDLLRTAEKDSREGSPLILSAEELHEFATKPLLPLYTSDVHFLQEEGGCKMPEGEIDESDGTKMLKVFLNLFLFSFTLPRR
jgi:hypothetical protein